MKLILCKLPSTLRGIYDIDRDGIKNEMPERALYAHPDLARAILRAEADGVHLRYSDIYRSASTSLARRKYFADKGGAQLAKRPAESPHNFGAAVDIDVAAVMRDLRLNKLGLDRLLIARYGLYCHRLDSALGAESWHYNALGPNAAPYLAKASTRSTSRAVEAKILAWYGNEMRLNRDEQIAALRALGHLAADATTIDKVRAAAIAFQKAWDLAADGVIGEKTQRLLAYLTATTEIVAP
jgi:hypothetical protein